MLNLKKLFKTILAAAISLFLFSNAAFAADLKSAKNNGWLGEQRNGYLGTVKGNTPKDVLILMKNVNSKRKSAYQRIATKEGIPLSSVEKISGNKAIEKTLSGNYIQSIDGKWLKK